MDGRVKPGNDDQAGIHSFYLLYFFAGAAGLSEVSGPAGLSRRSILAACAAWRRIRLARCAT